MVDLQIINFSNEELSLDCSVEQSTEQGQVSGVTDFPVWNPILHMIPMKMPRISYQNWSFHLNLTDKVVFGWTLWPW